MLSTAKGFKFPLLQGKKKVSYKNKTLFGLIHSTGEKIFWKLNDGPEGHVHCRTKMSYGLKAHIVEDIQVDAQSSSKGYQSPNSFGIQALVYS